MSDVEIVFGNVDDVARITGLSISTLNKRRLFNPELSPPFAKVGKRVVYPLTGPNSVSAWVARRIVNTEAAA